MQLPFAIFPLVMLTSDKLKMGAFANPLWLQSVGFLICLLVSALNVYLLVESIGIAWVLVGAAVMIAFALWVMYGYKERPKEAAA